MYGRLYKYILMAAAVFVISAEAQAREIIVYDGARVYNADRLRIHRQPTTISGTITKVQRGSFTLDVGGRSVKVDLEDSDLKGNPKDIFTEGMKVTVEGEFEDDGSRPNFAAYNIISMRAADTPPPVADDEDVHREGYNYYRHREDRDGEPDND